MLHDGFQVGLVVGGVVLLRWRLKRESPTEAAVVQLRAKEVSGGLPMADLPATAATGTAKQRRSQMGGSEPCGSPGGSAPSGTWPACVSLRQTDTNSYQSTNQTRTTQKYQLKLLQQLCNTFMQTHVCHFGRTSEEV